MPSNPLLAGLLLLSALGWLFCTVGWARVFNAGGDDVRLERLREIALVMTFTCAATAGAILLAAIQ